MTRYHPLHITTTVTSWPEETRKPLPSHNKQLKNLRRCRKNSACHADGRDKEGSRNRGREQPISVENDSGNDRVVYMFWWSCWSFNLVSKLPQFWGATLIWENELGCMTWFYWLYLFAHAGLNNVQLWCATCICSPVLKISRSSKKAINQSYTRDMSNIFSYWKLSQILVSHQINIGGYGTSGVHICWNVHIV